MKVETKINPLQLTGEQPSIGKERKFGNTPGSQFYNALRFKKVKGKNKVRGTLSRPTIPYDKRKGEQKRLYEPVEQLTPGQWSPEGKKQKYENQNKATDK